MSFKHIDEKYIREIEKLKSHKSYTDRRKIPMSRWIFKIAVLIAISGIIALFFVPKDYALIVCWIAGGALLVACGVMFIVGGLLPRWMREELNAYWKLKRPSVFDDD